MKYEGVMADFLPRCNQKRKKKGNEDDMATLDDSVESEFYRTLRRLAPPEPEFYGE